MSKDSIKTKDKLRQILCDIWVIVNLQIQLIKEYQTEKQAKDLNRLFSKEQMAFKHTKIQHTNT